MLAAKDSVREYYIDYDQGPTGSCFQLRDGSGSGIGKNLGFGFGYGSGSGIGTAFLSIGYYRVLKILIGYFSIKSMIRYFLLVQLRSSRPLDPSRPLVQIYKSFRAILGRCSSRAVEILSNKSKGPLKNYIDYWVYNKH